MGVFDPTVEELPACLPIFPLSGVLLLPRASLPLSIFEPRYLNMIYDALGNGRMIGMVQPKIPGDGENASENEIPAIYETGCMGRIIRFEEIPDGQLTLDLFGSARFRIIEENMTLSGYRQAKVDWSAFLGDLNYGEDLEESFNRDQLLEWLKVYFDHRGITADWSALADAQDEKLVNALSMICPFEPLEKQALLEAVDLSARADMLMALIEMAVLDTCAEVGDKAWQ